jgi:hypothetical protein
MYNINKHITRELNNEFAGSERKKTVEIDGKTGQRYLLKMSDPTREKNASISYINNAFSEYIGCHIAKMLGLDVQETILGEYTYNSERSGAITRPACLCKDVRNEDERMIQSDTISLSNYDSKDDLTFASVNELLHQIKGIDYEALEVFYYNMFVLDAFIGNTDRHNGNWAILEGKTSTRISPIYDCGSSLLPMIGDNEISSLNTSSVYLSICSTITDNGSRINYTHYLASVGNEQVDAGMKRIFPKINLVQINKFIDSIDMLSAERKELYKDFLLTRYQKILLPAIKRIFEYDKIVADTSLEKDALFTFYKENIERIASLNLFKEETIPLLNHKYQVMRISKGYAIFIKSDECVGILPIRTGNDSIRKAVTIIKEQEKLKNYNITKTYDRGDYYDR